MCTKKWMNDETRNQKCEEDKGKRRKENLIALLAVIVFVAGFYGLAFCPLLTVCLGGAVVGLVLLCGVMQMVVQGRLG